MRVEYGKHLAQLIEINLNQPARNVSVSIHVLSGQYSKGLDQLLIYKRYLKVKLLCWKGWWAIEKNQSDDYFSVPV